MYQKVSVKGDITAVKEFIKDIKLNTGCDTVYNITTSNHTYLIDDIIVHNCDEPLHRDPKAKLLATNADEIMELIKMHPSKIVTLTGGNPCIYDMSELVAAIKEEGLDVHVETQGTVMPQWLRDVDFITISPKGPSSGNPTDLFKLQQMLKRFRRTAKQIKPVVMVSNKGEVSEEDMSLLRKIVKMFPRNYVVAQLGDDGKEGMEYGARYRALCDRIHSEKELDNVRVLPQIHKIGGLR